MACSAGDVSAVVCARDAGRTIGACLRSVSAERPGERLLIDGLSRDGTRELAEAAGFRVISDGGLGLGAARQLGLANASRPLIWFVDADVTVPPGTLAIMLVEIADGPVLGAHARMRAAKLDTPFERGTDHHAQSFFNSRRRSPRIPMACALLHREEALRIGFDPGFVGACEDLDFCDRAVKAGLTFAVSRAEVFHAHRSTLDEFMRERMWFGNGGRRMFFKHRELRYILSPASQALRGAFRCLLEGRLDVLPYYPANALFFYAGVVGFGERRRHSREGGVRPPMDQRAD
jgi:glycosyltransferase involved in cell wall biosynthesis